MSAATTQSEQSLQTVSRRLAAEDIQIGSYVTVVQQISELVSFFWMGDTPPADREQPVMYRHTPTNSGEPYRVLAVCLPFVFAEDIRGDAETFDLRQCDLTQLTDGYVAAVRQKWQKSTACKSAKKHSRRKKRKSKRRQK
ncbi:MAG TPA: hypothetical protein EYG03_29165 [Planctomycetes bacterium]|nr:hypothetical protein [Fuerstiella sp.]HIK96034.1 hypothetical protein [Planctomycetota bacterium]